jgi:hypothetical protein
MMASRAYFDSYRRASLPANLIQTQHDYFGAHTYERVDAKDVFHTRRESSFLKQERRDWERSRQPAVFCAHDENHR